MTRSSCKAIFIVSLLAPLTGYTQEPIARCHGETQSEVTNDASCAPDMGTVAPLATRIPVATKTRTISQTSKFLAAEEARTVAFENRTLVTHRLPRDEATLKSVRTLTASMEEMTVAKRRQMLASFAVYP